jgi:hypothetical protein
VPLRLVTGKDARGAVAFRTLPKFAAHSRASRACRLPFSKPASPL